ncbi:unnamed protein product, partial [Hapterophycus canaliculatus]
MACGNYQRERCVAAEMEACWEPPSSNGASLPGYNPQNDRFCPLAVARRFNKMQHQASIGGTQSLIDLRQPFVLSSKETTTDLQRSSRRPRSTGGRMTAVLSPLIDNNGRTVRAGAKQGQKTLPCIAGASLQLQEGGGFTAIRQPPLRASKGLPSFSKVNKGLIRNRAKERQLVSKASSGTTTDRGGMEDGRGYTATAELGVRARQDFTINVSRRDDILQDVWLKMHSAEGFATVQGSGELAQLLKLYRSASLELIEDMMRNPELENIADAYTKKKGEGMRSYREAVAQDADFADGIPEAASWLGFSARRNPLFLPPKVASANIKPLADIGIEGEDSSDLLSRLRDAQSFVLLEQRDARSGGGWEARISNEEAIGFAGGGGDDAADILDRNSLAPGCDDRVGLRRSRPRDRLRALNTQLASAQENIRDLEENLRLLEAGRDRDRGRAMRVREAAAEAGRRKMPQKMFRLRGDAAVLEEGIEELDGDITASRVRLFAERLDVARKRMLKDALTAEISAKSRTRPRRAKKLNDKNTDNDNAVAAEDDDDKRHRQRNASASTIQARVRGMRARRLNGGKLGARGSSSITEFQGRNHRGIGISHDEEAAAVRIGAAVRGCLTRKGLSEEAINGVNRSESPIVAASNNALNAETKEEDGSTILSTGATAATIAQPTASPPPQRPLPSPPIVDGLAQLEVLGVAGVRAFFDSLGLATCADRLRQQRSFTDSVGSIDGAELAKVCRAANPDAALRAAGISARLHRVKLLSALGVGVDMTTVSGGGRRVAASAVLSSSSALGESGATCTSGGRGRGGSAAGTPVAAIVALQMVRQLRRELLPREQESGSAVGGESGFGGAPRAVETTMVVTTERESLVSVLLPELERLLCGQAQLQRQV